jgi:CoA:oxalate CoA-transferase
VAETHRAESSGPLSTLVVLDFTQFLAGPFCTQMLADLGATVLKIESREGDMTRGVAPHFVGDNSAYFWSLNRGKQSVVIDLKKERGREICLRLAEAADVVIENFRPGVMHRLGLGYEDMRSVNDRLVYCSISGFGQTGPLRDYPAYDAIVQAMAGTMSITGEPGRDPVIIGPPLGDIGAGLYAAVATLAALAERDRVGHGQYVDVAMLDAQLSMLSYHAVYYLVSGLVPTAQGRGHVSIPTYRSFVCEDGLDVFVTANTERMWAALCHVLELDDLTSDPRYATNTARLANKKSLWEVLEARFRSRSAEEWSDRLMEAGVPAARINTVDRAIVQPQAESRGMVLRATDRPGNEVRVLGNPMKLSLHEDLQDARVPELGEDTADVLAGVLALDMHEIEALAAAGVIGTAPSAGPTSPADGHR